MSFSQRFQDVRTGFERPFWVANISEIFERISYYGAFASLAVYLQETLNFSTQQTGTLTGLFGGMVWFLAIFGGAIADRLGFRRALSLAYLILAAAYFLIGSIGSPWLAPVRNTVPLIIFVGFVLMLPALGISMVKPCVVGTTARASKDNVRSLGYSIYYTMVNIGSASGPYIASWAHRHFGVETVFRVAAASVFLMFFGVLIFFREPARDPSAPAIHHSAGLCAWRDRRQRRRRDDPDYRRSVGDRVNAAAQSPHTKHSGVLGNHSGNGHHLSRLGRARRASASLDLLLGDFRSGHRRNYSSAPLL